MDNRAIGIFDSGLGGLTCVKKVMEIMPEEDIITDNSSPGSGSIMESAMAILGDLQEVQE